MKARVLLIILVSMCLAASQLYAVPEDKTFTSSGQILDGEEWNNVYVYNDATIVDMLGGTADGIAAYDASTINMSGGSINTFDALEFSTANISGGSVYGLSAWGHSTVTFSESAVASGLNARGDFSTLNITGGSTDRAGALDSAILNIFGGIISEGVGAGDSAYLNMSGGSTATANFIGQSTANLYGGTIADYLMAAEDSVINVFGHDLARSSTGGAYGFGQVYGFWLDDVPFTIDLNGSETYTHINLVPEPTTLSVLAVAALLLKMEKGAKS